jgi:hypothetical protein
MFVLRHHKYIMVIPVGRMPVSKKTIGFAGGPDCYRDPRICRAIEQERCGNIPGENVIQ